MTTDLTLKAIQQWIELRVAQDYPELADVAIYLRDNETEKEPPNIILKESGAEEHPVLRGVLQFQVEAILETVPALENQQGHTEEEHQALNSALFEILTDVGPDDEPACIAHCDAYPGLKVFDIRGVSPTTETEDGNRVTRYEMRVVACPR